MSHIGLADHPIPQGDLALISVGSDMVGIRQVGNSEGTACQIEKEEEAAGGDVW